MNKNRGTVKLRASPPPHFIWNVEYKKNINMNYMVLA